MPMPYRLLVGNHDDCDALRETFPEIGHSDRFLQRADDPDGARLLYLDTPAAEGRHHGELCPTRMRWLSDQISSADARPLLIFQHHPSCEIGFRYGNCDCAAIARVTGRLQFPFYGLRFAQPLPPHQLLPWCTV